ncbi:hypothetical protein WJX72_006997 [[Myrmecia] bisecta]|uniref:AB hydrolase-1 domain-containing protein n=1 Tax=[Myrmecia] bisecta TaxID=41462 RepID=A0AAW1R713_9CHLO
MYDAFQQHGLFRSSFANRCTVCSNRSLRLRAFKGNGDSKEPEARSRRAANRSLLKALREQARRDTLPFLRDLVQPFLDGPPRPLTDTVSPQDLADPDSQFTEVDGVMLHYKDYGNQAPGAPTVLMLHGLNGSVFNWRASMQPIAEACNCRVIAFDRPPYGLSERPLSWASDAENPYSNEGGAKLGLGVQQAVLVGHSAGALVAMEMFKRSPEMVAGFVFVAPALPTNQPKSGQMWKASLGQQLQRVYTRALLQTDGPGLHFVRRSIQKRSEEVRQGKLNMYHDTNRQAAQDVIDGYLKPMRTHDWDRGALYSFRTFSFPADLPYAAVTQPVVFITGEKDEPLRSSAQKVAEILEQRPVGSTLYIEYAACGHIPMDEYPERFNADVIAFLRSEAFRQPPDTQAMRHGLAAKAEANGEAQMLPLFSPQTESAPPEAGLV